MQVNLVCPPFAFPFNPPIGIAYLKAYLGKYNPDIAVSCVDLNLKFHDLVYNTAELKNPKTKKDVAFLATKEFFHQKNEVFFNAETYHKNASLFKQVFESFYHRYNILFQELLQGTKKQRVDLLKTLVRIILKNKPDVVGISVNYVEQWYVSLLLGMLIKSLSKAKVVFGGSFLAVDTKKKFSRYAMDYVIKGEGEKSFRKLLEKKDEDSFEKIPGLVYEKDGIIIENSRRLVSNLDELPFPDYSDFKLNGYYSPEIVLPILSSRGCYWRKCAFCSHHQSYGNYRSRSVENIIEELKQRVKKGVKYFYFVDEHIPAQTFMKISERIVKEKMNIRYLSLAKPTKDFTTKITSMMYKSGCRMLIWGVESGSQRVLDKMQKGTKVEGIKEALKNSSLAGIRNHIYILAGFPSETKEEFGESLKFCFDNKEHIHSIHPGTFTLCSGSPVFENPKKYGVMKIKDADKPLISYSYEVEKGLDEQTKKALLVRNIGFFNRFNPFSFHLKAFRENALIIYSNVKKFNDSERELVLE